MICMRCGWDLPDGELQLGVCRNVAKCKQRLTCSKKIQAATATATAGDDPINHPAHYTQHPAGVECITITEHFNFNVGNAIKYCWRAGLKSASPVEDLKKAAWYITRELERLRRMRQNELPAPDAD